MNTIKRFFGFLTFNLLLSNAILANAVALSRSISYQKICDPIVQSYGIIEPNKDNEEPIDLKKEKSFSPVEKITLISPYLKIDNKQVDIPEEATNSMISTGKELELFYGQGKDSKKSFLNITKRTTTIFGDISYANILFQPINNVEKIKNRQNFVKALLENEELFEIVNNLLKKVAEKESQIISFFEEEDEFIENELKKSFFNWYGFKKFNNSELALESSYHASNLLNSALFIYFLKNFGSHALNAYTFNKCRNGHSIELSKNTKISYLESILQTEIESFKSQIEIFKFLSNIGVNKEKFKNRVEFFNEMVSELVKEKKKLPSLEESEINKRYHDDSEFCIGSTSSLNDNGEWTSEKNWTNDSSKVKVFLAGSSIGAGMNGIAASYYGYKGYKDFQSQQVPLKYMQTKLTAVATLLESIKEIENLAIENSEIKEALSSFENIANIFTSTDQDFQKLISRLQTITFKSNYSYFSRLGRISVNYKRMKKNKEKFIDVMQVIGELDALMSIAKLYKEFKEHKNVNYCFVEFVEQDTPYIYLQDFFNPFVDPNIVVKNTIEFGKDSTSRNMILTGSNTGGKSTILKGIMLNLLMSRFGIAPAAKAVMTPFTYLASSMNISDDTDSGISLFKAETLRAKKIIQDLQSLSKNQHAFVIIDELFVGTGPEKGSQAALKFVDYLSKFNNTICAFATHFPVVTTLEKKENSTFKNYKVDVYKDTHGNIVRPFKIVPGVSKVNIANELLQEEIDTIDFM